jgi:glycine cleavage system H protein
MSSDLEYTIDKFTFRVPQDRLYTPDDCWALVDGDQARLGITDFRQQASGDVAFIETVPVGMILSRGEEFATIETMKVDLAIPCPLSGTVTAVNPALVEHPELLNQDPYGDGWLVVITLRSPDQVQSLLSPAGYFAGMCARADSEGSKI